MPAPNTSLAAVADAVTTREPSVKELLLLAQSSLRKFGLIHGLVPIPVAEAQQRLAEALAKLG